MAKSGRSIILSVGIAAGAPFTLGAIPRVTSISPNPQLSDSIVVQRTQTGQIITVNNNAYPTATEVLQLVGGLISDTGTNHGNVIVGQGATALLAVNARNVAIGTGISSGLTANAFQNVFIGYNISANVDIGSTVLLGAGIIIGGATPVPTTIVGANNTANNGFSGPGVGTGCSWQGANVGIGNQVSIGAVNNGVAVGRAIVLSADGSTVVGDNARGQATHTNSVTLGRNTLSIAANAFTVGATNTGITTIFFGEGDTVAAPATVTHRYTNASGVNAQGANVVFQASLGTGNIATQGQLIFSSGVTTVSGSASQVATQRLAVIVPTTAANAAVNFLNTVNQAAAAGGTLTNAPAAGNPTFWLPILVAGVIKSIPCW